MSVDQWSTSADQNTSVSGVNVGENCNPGNINNAIRAIMAAVKAKFDSLPASGGNFMPKAGGVFTGGISFADRGAYIHHADPTNNSGRVFIQAAGGTPPQMANGDILIEY